MKVLLLVLVLSVFSVWAQTQCPRCTPLCQNGDGSTKLCGDDGCGGSCGICPSGQACCQGTCACQPNCNGRQCGDDGCGYESCGRCSTTQTCQNGVCTGTATAECSGRTCGSNRAGGSCGSCSNGQRCRAGQCECFYDCNERNCGNAVQPSDANPGLCPQRSCGTCPTGFTCGSNGRCSALTPCTVSITVVDCNTRRSTSGTSTVVITSGTYSTTITVSGSAATSWNTPSTGTFRFVTTQSGYLTGNQTFDVTTTTTAIELCIIPATVQLDVRDITTNRSISIATTVTYTGLVSGSLRWTAVTTFTHGGYGSYSFVATPDSGYLTGRLDNFQLTSTTTLIIIYVQPATVQIDIRERATDLRIDVGATVTYSGVVSGSFRWNGLYTFQHGGYGSYNFFALPDSTYTNGSTSVQITSSTSLIIIYVDLAEFCGNGRCAGTETASFCPEDCTSLFFEFENADGSGPVNGPTVNYFLTNPRDANANTGPNRNGVVATTSRTTGTASNTVLEETYSYGIMVYVETTVTNFINFYWVANTSNIDPELGVYRLRVHLSRTLGANDFNYRFVNTWRPIDAEPAPYSPTDLNLHLFYQSGALDINNNRLTENGFAIGAAVADSKQSGGPATMDISPGSNILIGVWNSKPPRNSAIAPSQNNRYIVNSGSYVVIYGKTSNAASGKQVGQVVLDQLLQNQPSLKSDTRSDLWYVGSFTVSSPGQNQPSVTAGNKLKASRIDSLRDMYFDCEVYTYCNNFRVPYSDTGRRSVDEE